LSENGLHLHVPALAGGQSYRLTGKQMAARLFSKADIHTAKALLDIARITSAASATRKDAVLAERKRVMHDLHDTVGARLLSLSHDISNPQHRKAAQDTLQILRDMIHLSLQKTPFVLEEYLADWRAETVERTEAASIHLHWQADPAAESLTLPPEHIVELMLFVRETVDAALKHSHLTTLAVDFSLVAGRPCAVIICDNDPSTTATCCPGSPAAMLTTPAHISGQSV
jgi:signal transduction histidine kinase